MNINEIKNTFIRTDNISAERFLAAIKKTNIIREFKIRNRFMYCLKYIIADDNNEFKSCNVALLVYWPSYDSTVPLKEVEYGAGELYVNPKYKDILEGVKNEKV